MTSGVYRLTFSSGSTYIGKSIDIDNRWKQHGDKFRKGTAAKLMQTEFDNYGPADGEVLFECHEDHIDIVEACLINRLKPNLNGTYPKDPFDGIYDDEYEKLFALLNMSTVQHVAKIYEFNDAQTLSNSEISGLKESLIDAEELIEALSKKRTQETIDKDISRKILDQQVDIMKLDIRISTLDSERHALSRELAYANLPWWKKLFN